MTRWGAAMGLILASGRPRVGDADPSRMKLGVTLGIYAVRRGSRQLCPALHWSTLPLG